MITQSYTWINKSLSLVRQSFIVVALNTSNLLLLIAARLQCKMPAAGPGSI